MAIRNETLETTDKNIFICPVGEEHAVTCIVFCNHSVAQVTIDVHAVPTGGAVGAGSIIMKDLLLPAGETFTFDTEKFILAGGDRLSAIASADASVTTTISSMRVS